MVERVFITGGTGFIGRALVRALRARGDEIVVLSRREAVARAELGDGVEIVVGDPTAAGPWQAAVAGATAVVNLAGESLAARRWNAQVRQILRDSRLDATRLVVEAIAAAPVERRPRVLVNASGVDYYPFDDDLGASAKWSADDPIDEQAPPGSTFLAKLCREWEAEAVAAEGLGLRVVRLRTGLVIGDGGAAAKLAAPFKLFVGGRLGKGTQWTSWIHLDDVVGAIRFAIDHAELSGPINLVAPENVRNTELARALAARLHRPAWLPVPAVALKLSVGELAEYILHGRRVVPTALERAGYEFEHAALADALRATSL